MTVRLAGRLLVASPGLGDPNFVRTVVLLVEHGPEGAVGLVLNRPTEVEVGSVLPEWADSATPPTVLFQGGPVGLDGVLALGLLSTGEPAGGGPVGWRPLDSALGLVDLDEPSVQPFLGGLRLFAGYAGWGAGHHHGDLAEDAVSRPRSQLGEATPAYLFVGLGQLPADGRRTVRPERRGGVGEHLGQPVRRLEEHHRAALGRKLCQRGATRPTLARQEALEAEPVRGEAGQSQRREHRRGAWYGGDPDPRDDRRGDKAISGI